MACRVVKSHCRKTKSPGKNPCRKSNSPGATIRTYSVPKGCADSPVLKIQSAALGRSARRSKEKKLSSVRKIQDAARRMAPKHMSPFTRPNLIVQQTLLKKGKKRLEFNGLFTSESIPKGGFIGFYSGDFFDEEDEIPNSHYALNGSGYTVVPPGENTRRGVDPLLHPLGMANEPPLGTVANATVVEWSLAKDAIPGIDPKRRVGVLAIHACRDIEVGEEIYFHYGELYDRRHYGRKPYNVGKGCTISRKSIPEDEKPRNMMLRNNVTSVPEGLVYTSQ